MKRVKIFLIIIALIVGTAGCGGDDIGNSVEAYTLTIDNTTGGSVTVDNVAISGGLTLTYEVGTVVSLNASPDSGYQFLHWTGDVYTIDNVHASQTVITVNGNYSIMAEFEVLQPVQYSLTIISPAHGSVITPGEATFFIYEKGTVVNLLTKPDTGYEFVRWTGDVDTIANVNAASTTITMNGDYYICAHFREIPVVC